MPTAAILALVLMVASGVAVAAQAPINAMLGRGIGSAMGAATVSFGVGFVILLALTVLIGDGGSLLRVREVPPWMLVGGAMGALYVFAALWAVPTLGVLTVMALVIAGQMAAALVIDQFGLLGLAVREASLPRILGAVMIAGGVVLSRF